MSNAANGWMKRKTMPNAEVIKALRCCADSGCFEGCPRLVLVEDALECRERLMNDAADALEAADEKIVELQKQVNEFIKTKHVRLL